MGNILSAEGIAEIILGSNDIIISSHIGADGDAVGSVAALLLALKKRGKNVRAVLEALPRKYSEIEGAVHIGFGIDCPYKTFIALDCGDKSRLGKFEKSFDKAEVTINIDHHASNDFFGMYNCVEGEASATSEIIYKVLASGGGFEIDKDIASALYAGILYDTGGFRHSCATGYTYDVAGRLITLGADFNRIYKKMFHTIRFAEAKILSTALKNIKQEFGGQLVWTSISSAELAEANARPSDLDSVVDYCKSIEGSKIAAFIYQKGENEYKISLRSEPEYDIMKTAVKLGGGGHKNAAGSTLHGTFEECLAETLAEIEKVLLEEV